jgi:hypothetical protein
MGEDEARVVLVVRRELARCREDGVSLIVPAGEPDGRPQEVTGRRVRAYVPRARREARRPRHVASAVCLMRRTQQQLSVTATCLQLPGRHPDEIGPPPHAGRLAGVSELALDRCREQRAGRPSHDIGIERMAQPQLTTPSGLAQDHESTALETEQRLAAHELLGRSQAQRFRLGNDVEGSALGFRETLNP